MTNRKRLVFVSTRFLFPVDSGGKIRTTQILKGLKDSEYEIVLLSPGSEELTVRYESQLTEVCDQFHWWPEQHRGRLFHLMRLRHILSALPIPIKTDWNNSATRLITDCLPDKTVLAVFDFLHAAVLAPEHMPTASLLFTHNVETEIFQRHRDVAKNPLMRWLWQNQSKKMEAFEEQALQRFDAVVAVSEKDKQSFAESFNRRDTCVIPTGVDLDFFSYSDPDRDNEIVFCGSMDWLANQEAINYFMDDIWPIVASRHPKAHLSVVGRNPPASLVERARSRGLNWKFTGFVDDVRDHLRGAAVSVIPMRVGSGTRLKAYEALALGTPLVSTSVGIEGLPIEDGTHYLLGDTPIDFADALSKLLNDVAYRTHLAKQARAYVEENFSYQVAAQAFKNACDLAVSRHADAKIE